MSIAQAQRIQRHRYWSHVGRMVKGFGRAFAVKKLSTMVPPEVARAMVKRYLSNQRARPRKVFTRVYA